MGLKKDLEDDCKDIYESEWNRRKGQSVPQSKDIGLGAEAVDLEVAMLYADITGSTQLVDGYKDRFAAKQYKAFLRCATKIIRDQGGYIRSYDGDRVMGVFHGGSKCTSSVKCALKINWAVHNIINPALEAQYPKEKYRVNHRVGVDYSDIMAIRAGIRNNNDISWIGRSANYAAKLSSLKHGSYRTWITEKVYKKMHDDVTYSDNKNMWVKHNWDDMNDQTIYGSTYYWAIK